MKKTSCKRLMSLALALIMMLTLGLIPASASSDVDTVLSQMTLRQKVTQMMMMEFRTWNSDGSGAKDFTVMNDDVRKILADYDFGAVILMANNIQTTEDTFKLVQDMQAAATADGGIPLILSVDQEGGSVYRLGSGTALPGNMALGATFDSNNAYLAGKIIGSELGVLGINTSLSPVVDVNNNANNPVIGLRSFGDDASAVGEMASKYIQGMAEYDVIGCAKHFPGHGDTGTDSHYGLPIVDKSKAVLESNELLPYKIAISQGIEMIMTAHILYPQLESDTVYSEKTGKNESLPATMSDDILTGLLKGDMGFEGIICTDAMRMAGISDYWDSVQATVNAIKAGADMICAPADVFSNADLPKIDAVIDGVVAAVESGEIPQSRIDDACRRILTVKANHGILDYDPSDYSLSEALNVVGGTENRTTERQIAAKAVTVTQNNNNTLPLTLSENSKVLMLTPYNNELGQLVMGWNRAKEAGLVPDGAQVKVVRYSGSDITDYKSDIDWADTVWIDSEISSATSIKNSSWTYTGPRALLEYAEENGKTTIVMSIDKPYDVQEYPEADAVLAVYGCKGSTVDPTEALSGGTTESKAACGPNITAGVEVALGVFGASGKLPINIPKLNRDTYTYADEILYARGYGLSYPAVNDDPEPEEPECPFTDLGNCTEDAITAILWCYNNGITQGTTATTFSPDNSCTRSQAVTFLWRAAGCPEPTSDVNPFVDVQNSGACQPFYKAILWAYEKGITNGVDATHFAPYNKVSRAQLVTFLWRYENRPESTFSVDCFNDASSIASPYVPAIAWAIENGVTVGYEDNTFRPNNVCTRRAVALFMYRNLK